LLQRTVQIHGPCSSVQTSQEDHRGRHYVRHELSPVLSHSHFCVPRPVVLLHIQRYPVRHSSFCVSYLLTLKTGFIRVFPIPCKNEAFSLHFSFLAISIRCIFSALVKINMEKTKVMATDKDNTQMDTRVGNKKIRTIIFTYLGMVLTNDRSYEKDI